MQCNAMLCYGMVWYVCMCVRMHMYISIHIIYTAKSNVECLGSETIHFGASHDGTVSVPSPFFAGSGSDSYCIFSPVKGSMIKSILKCSSTWSVQDFGLPHPPHVTSRVTSHFSHFRSLSAYVVRVVRITFNVFGGSAGSAQLPPPSSKPSPQC